MPLISNAIACRTALHYLQYAYHLGCGSMITPTRKPGLNYSQVINNRGSADKERSDNLLIDVSFGVSLNNCDLF